MRKLWSVAVCALALACAGAAQAGPEAKAFTASPIDHPAPRLQQALLTLDSGRPAPRKTAPESAARVLAPASVDAQQIDGSGTGGMLLAGLMVMGVIIKRRYGKDN